jgi:hypothetical protein
MFVGLPPMFKRVEVVLVPNIKPLLEPNDRNDLAFAANELVHENPPRNYLTEYPFDG